MKRIILYILFASIYFSVTAQKANTYSNPILAGFYPDPSICRVNNDYYIVNSSFAYYPGLPIFHSTDLVNWKQLGHAMDRPEQLDLMGAGVSRGLFAPAISYHKGTFYIVCTLIDKGGNFVITAKDPAGPWSNPVWLKELDGIDPSIFFDEDDKAYIVYNSVAPNNSPQWDGHRTIRMRAFDYKNFKVSNEEKLLVNGGSDISKKPVWIEGPHLYKINGQYYLLCAEGGTAYNHSEVVFRSTSLDAPFKPYEGNPILTQRHLNPDRPNPITTVGHADLVETPNGEWYAVFLGTRPYTGNHYNTGRETYLAPVRWKEGWPIITEGNELVKYAYPRPSLKASNSLASLFSGNFTYQDEFTSNALNKRYFFLRTVTKPWYSTTEKKGNLTLLVRPETVSGSGNPSFVAHRQQHLQCTVETALKFKPASENEKAGLIIFQSEHNYYYLCQSIDKGVPVVQLYQSTTGEDMKLLASQSLKNSPQMLNLKIQANGQTYDFLFSTDNKNWQALKEQVDARFLSTETAGGFVGAVFGMYTTSLGKPSSTKAYFDRFVYKGLDDIYKK
jgi:alpha-N-arabinofuranosidase